MWAQVEDYLQRLIRRCKIIEEQEPGRFGLGLPLPRAGHRTPSAPWVALLSDVPNLSVLDIRVLQSLGEQYLMDPTRCPYELPSVPAAHRNLTEPIRRACAGYNAEIDAECRDMLVRIVSLVLRHMSYWNGIIQGIQVPDSYMFAFRLVLPQSLERFATLSVARCRQQAQVCSVEDALAEYLCAEMIEICCKGGTGQIITKGALTEALRHDSDFVLMFKDLFISLE